MQSMARPNTAGCHSDSGQAGKLVSAGHLVAGKQLPRFWGLQARLLLEVASAVASLLR